MIAGVLAWPTDTARAQASSEAFGGFARNSNEPIDIESDTLEVQDAKKVAIFRGNVKAVQGGMTVRSRELHVNYEGDQATSGTKSTSETKSASGSKSEITRIRAKGKVLITTENDQNTTSDWADFDVPGQLVTIGGNVVLTQGGNVIKGDKLVINLKTGVSRFENQGGPWTPLNAEKRVKGLFLPKKRNGKDSAQEPDKGQEGTATNPSPPRQ
ncbi:MAG: LptA/OstA family protein [Methyloligellaceae bacterium]